MHLLGVGLNLLGLGMLIGYWCLYLLGVDMFICWVWVSILTGSGCALNGCGCMYLLGVDMCIYWVWVYIYWV